MNGETTGVNGSDRDDSRVEAVYGVVVSTRVAVEVDEAVAKQAGAEGGRHVAKTAANGMVVGNRRDRGVGDGYCGVGGHREMGGGKAFGK